MERALGWLKKIIGWIIAEGIAHFGNVECDVVTQKAFSCKGYSVKLYRTFFFVENEILICTEFMNEQR